MLRINFDQSYQLR